MIQSSLPEVDIPAVEQAILDAPLRVIGAPTTKIDAEAKVRGRAKYASDFSLPDMLYGKVLFSDRPHARIVRRDFRAALALEGVYAVIGGREAPEARYGLYTRDRHIFAKQHVRYVGEPIAAVAASSERIAIQALSLIEVEYEDLPAVLDVEAALIEGAIHLHPDQDSYSSIFPYIRYGNVNMDARLEIGDIEAGFAQADQIFEDLYETQAMHHVSLEPHASLASFDHTGRLTVWTGTQQLSVCHFELASALELPMNQVRVIPLWLGGGFGGKVKSHLEPICALLARATDRPVRIVLTREEEFINAKARPPYRIRLKTGVKNDGTLVAREADILVDSGGYTDHALGTAAHALSCVQSTYRIPNLKARSRSVYTNNPDWGCMRGYGTIQALFAAEAQMDVIARALKMDPAELRLKNLLQDGDTWITGEKVRGVQVRATMEAALEASGYWEKKGRLPAHQGIGIANLVKSCGLLSSAASIKANEDGTLSVISAVQDIGTGSHTVLCQIAAETLGLPLERVRIAAGDSDSAPYDTGSIASRTTFDAGNAVRLAAEDLRHNLKRVAAKAFNCSLDEVLYEDGRAFCRGREDQGMHFEALVGASIYAFHGPVMGHGAWMGAPPFAEQPGEGYPEGPYPTYAYGTHVVEVEVDPDTGKIKILDLTACHDVGRVLLPAGIQGQVEGGVVQGIGYGLFEELLLEQGAVQNPNLVDYKIATALDVPRVKMSFIEIPDAKGPFGAKGIGEHPILGPAPALLNAVLDATGVAFHRIPLTVERMYFALQDRRDEAGDGQEKKDP